MNYKTPGVYIEEIPKLPPSIAQVETAIPAFIGYTETAEDEIRGEDLRNVPKRITSLHEYERFYGQPPVETSLSVLIKEKSSAPPIFQASVDPVNRSKYLMHYALQMFFANGGGPCWVVSVGDYTTGTVGFAELQAGLNAN